MYTCQLHYDDKVVDLPFNKMTFFDELYVDLKSESPINQSLAKGISNSTRFQLTIHPKQDVVIKNITIQQSRDYQNTDTIFCNGYQSWSESRAYTLDEQLPNLRSIAKSHLGYWGDYHIPQIKRGKGHLHSWTYSYIRQNKGVYFVGSLSEQSAFTLIQHDTNKSELSIQKDCDGLTLSHSYPALDIIILEGKENAVFDSYFDLMNLPAPKAKPAIGWTSWYHYYTDISEEIILKNLEAFTKVNEENKGSDRSIIFQIDDGFQSNVGDWLKFKNTFPNGLANIAQKIHQKGYLAGLWLAPFICNEASDIFKTKQHWLVKNKTGQPLKAGKNDMWGGAFYVLDFYHNEVQEYLTSVFVTILEKWGFDMLKLDFLYAVCIQPPANKTRGQMMCDAMNFIRNIAGNKLLLGCGVPLGAAFGLVDYCRIGADIHLQWEHRLLKFLRHRERVSTIVALRTVLGRWQLNDRAFINDPDVFILRKEKNKLTPTQQYTILIINTLLGDLLFTSDYLADYSAEQWGEFLSIFKWQNSKVSAVNTISKDVYEIKFTNDGKTFSALSNLTGKKVSVNLANKNIALEKYETLILKS